MERQHPSPFFWLIWTLDLPQLFGSLGPTTCETHFIFQTQKYTGNAENDLKKQHEFARKHGSETPPCIQWNGKQCKINNTDMACENVAMCH